MAQVAIVPLVELVLPTVISTFSRYGPGLEIANHATGTLINGTWGVANRAQLYQMTLITPYTVRFFRWIAGTAVVGNYDIGIYDRNLSLLRSNGTAPHPGANTFVELAITPLSLQPGNYWLAFAADNAGFGIFARPISLSGELLTMPIRMALASFPLPPVISASATSGARFQPISLSNEAV